MQIYIHILSRDTIRLIGIVVFTCLLPFDLVFCFQSKIEKQNKSVTAKHETRWITNPKCKCKSDP